MRLWEEWAMFPRRTFPKYIIKWLFNVKSCILSFTINLYLADDMAFASIQKCVRACVWLSVWLVLRGWPYLINTNLIWRNSTSNIYLIFPCLMALTLPFGLLLLKRKSLFKLTRQKKKQLATATTTIALIMYSIALKTGIDVSHWFLPQEFNYLFGLFNSNIKW